MWLNSKMNERDDKQFENSKKGELGVGKVSINHESLSGP